MAEYRRKQFYIDRMFQNKFLFLFLGLCALGAAGNVLFLYLYLKQDVEDSMFRSRILISNVNEVLISNVVYFNVALLITSALLAALFYLLIRRRVKNVLARLDSALKVRTAGAGKDINSLVLPHEFEDLQETLGNFFDRSDRTLQQGQAAIAALESFAESPDEQRRRAALERLDMFMKGE